MKSEINQKGNNEYCILSRIYGIWKYGTDEPIFRAAKETQTLRTVSGHSEGNIEWDKLRE